jgi:hypothetical protein
MQTGRNNQTNTHIDFLNVGDRSGLHGLRLQDGAKSAFLPEVPWEEQLVYLLSLF